MPSGSICPEGRVLARALLGAMMCVTAHVAADGAAQSAAGAGTFRSGTDLVALPVTVVDARGAYVPDLLRSDFAVYEEGVPQAVTLFATSSVPLDLMLLLDTSGSMHGRMAAAQDAAIELVRALRPEDRAAVVVFADRVQIAEALTKDGVRLEAAIRQSRAGGGTALHEALYVALRELGRQQTNSEPRRQALVVLSDGDDTTSRAVGLRDVLEEARRHPVMVFTIVPATSFMPASLLEIGSRRRTAEHNLRTLAEETGGRSFVPMRDEDLSATYRQIAEELGQQYWLAYAPASSRGGFRRVSVRIVTQPGLRARTRSGYYAGPRRGDAPGLSDAGER